MQLKERSQNRMKKEMTSEFIYCCYRHGFPEVGGYTDDVGWGCTVRSFQMLIANTISKFRKDIDPITFVIDYKQAPFSLQNMVITGGKYGVEPGDWFSPSIAAKVLRDIMKEGEGSLEEVLEFRVIVYGEDYKKGEDGSKFQNKPALVILPVKLGVDTIDESYHDVLSEILKDTRCRGVIGGNGSSSFFFTGIDESRKVTYLDPHDMREHDDPNYVARKVHKMSMSAMNPSVAIAIFITDWEEMEIMMEKYSQVFTIADVVDDGKRYSCIENDDYCIIMEEDT